MASAGKEPPAVGVNAKPRSQNPAFAMLGFPRLRKIKLPSKKWLTFFCSCGIFCWRNSVRSAGKEASCQRVVR